ncbi:hypothetical protein ZIOFF_044496 [Zingiber officinale]|uniref:Uncharacterized protein n=1 Tax=Zingiber officinale TaxID=94328 RepID=A0A8J5FYL8_ZINOF|nr:hypothetical protein ZIOFF_044496 [Zingiber officinale]
MRQHHRGHSVASCDGNTPPVMATIAMSPAGLARMAGDSGVGVQRGSVTSAENGNASLHQEKVDTNATVVLHKPDVPKLGVVPKTPEQTSSCSTPSSSGTSSEDDFFLIDTSQPRKPIAVLDEIPRNNSQLPLPIENVLSNANLSVSGEQELKDLGMVQGMISGSTSPGISSTAISFSYDASGTPGSVNFGFVEGNHSLIEMPYGPNVPDPKRIPSSVFARTKSTAMMEWSVASNESLFSIQVGKSGDLSSLYNTQLDGYPPLSPHISSTSPLKDAEAGPSLQQTVDADTANAEAMEDVLKATTEKHAEKDKPLTVHRTSNSDSASQLSDGGSVKSYRSFAFPILTADSRSGSVNGELVDLSREEGQMQPPVPQPPPEMTEAPRAEPVKARKSPLCCERITVELQ